jgi:hypothetical protein
MDQLPVADHRLNEVAIADAAAARAAAAAAAPSSS